MNVLETLSRIALGLYQPFSRVRGASLAASVFMVLAVGGSLLWSTGARADTFTWVGGSEESEEYTPGFADIFIPGAPDGLGSYWASGGILKKNWQKADGSTPTRSPNENDSVIFGSGFHSGVPISNQDRVIHDLTLDADHDLVLAFKGQGSQEVLKTLGLVSGQLDRTEGSSGGHYIDGNIVNFQPAVWDIDGSGKLEVRGSVLAAGGFTKAGPGTLTIRDIAQMPTLQVNSGTMNINGLLTTANVAVGDADASTGAQLRSQLGFAANQITLYGGTVRSEGNVVVGNITAAQAFDAPLITSSVISIEPNAALQFTGEEGRFVVQAAANDAPVLVVEAAVETPRLVLEGGGKTEFRDRAGVSPQNRVGETYVKSGTLVLNRGSAPNSVGNLLRIGTPEGDTSAAVVVRIRDQIGDDTPVHIAPGGVLSIGFFEGLGKLTFSGGRVEGAVVRLLQPTTEVSGANRTSHLSAQSVDLNGQTHTVEAAAASTLDISSTLLNGSLKKTLPGTLRLTGDSANQIGSVSVEGGSLELAKPHGTSAVGDDLVVGTQGQTSGGPSVFWHASDQVKDDVLVKFRSGTLNLNGHTDRIRGINASGTGSMSVATGGGGGTLEFGGNSTAFLGAQVLLAGNYSLGGETRNLDARGGTGGDPNFTNWRFFGATINDGTFRKIGAGRAELASVSGDALLAIANGSVRVNGTTLGGLTGSGNLELAGGFTVNQTGGERTFSGILSGNGNFTKAGSGSLTLAGDAANSLAGTVRVTGGTLHLGKQSAVAVPGNLTIASGGRVVAEAFYQFDASSHVAITGGELDLNAYDQHVARLEADGGTLRNGVLGATQGVELHNAMAEQIGLFVTAGGLQVTGSSNVEAIGHVTDNSKLESDAVLRIGSMVNHPGPDLTFSNTLQLYHGSTLELLPHVADDDALVRVGGSLLVGEPQIQIGASARLTGMDGVATIDLSLSGPLDEGTYNLIDFSDTPFTVPGVDDSLFASMQHFDTVAPPNTAGSFQIVDNVLQFVSLGAAILPGDYNDDGVVDAADYTVWRNNLGSDITLPNDDTPGVGTDDYERWKSHYGQLASGAASVANASHQAVPEPAAALLLFGAIGLWGCRRRRGRR